MDDEHAENTSQAASIIGMLNDTTDLDLLQVLKTLESLVVAETAPLILGAIVGIYGRELNIQTEKKADFISNMNSIKKKLEEYLSSDMKRLIPANDIVLVEQPNKIQKETNLMKAIEKLVVETLIRKSKHEIWNSLNVYFGSTGDEEFLKKEEVINYIFSCLITASRVSKGSADTAECIFIAKELAFVASEEDAEQLLDLFLGSSEYFDVFLIALRSSNVNVYTALQNLIYTEKRYFKECLITAFPDIEFPRLVSFVKDYNWDVTATLLQKRPILAKELIETFHRGELGISRRFFLEAIQKQGDVFSNFISELNLASEEIVDICTRSYNFTKKYFYLIETEEQMLQFCKILSKREEAAVLGFVKEIESIPTFELFLKTFLKTSRLTGELKGYIISKYSDNPAYFNSLISYLDIESLEELLEKYYDPKSTMELLLRRFYPQELIIELHRFKNTVLTSSLIPDCINDTRFEDKDWVMAMKSLDSVHSFLKSTTSLLILQKKPNLRVHAISFLKKTVCDALWDSQTATADFIRCLEFLGEDCFTVFDSMTKSEIVFVLEKSRKLEQIVRNFFKNYNGTLPQNLMFVWNCLRMI